jgi:hypothetical protein
MKLISYIDVESINSYHVALEPTLEYNFHSIPSFSLNSIIPQQYPNSGLLLNDYHQYSEFPGFLDQGDCSYSIQPQSLDETDGASNAGKS